MRHLWILTALLLGCGSSLPSRFVLERDIEEFSYRRYQKVLDEEVQVPGNNAVGHTAGYVRRDGGRIVAFAIAFVTVYDRAAALSAEIRIRLKDKASYSFSVKDVGGGHVWVLDGGETERWALWVSGRYLIKVGAPTYEKIPEQIVADYMIEYPSDLDEHGYAREGTASFGTAKSEADLEAEEEKHLPRDLREGAPR